MNSFSVYLSEQVDIKTDNYNKGIDNLIADIKDREEKRKQEAKKINKIEFLKELETELSEYPNIKNLIKSLNTNNYDYIFDQQKKLRDWSLNQKDNLKFFPLSRKLNLYVSSIEEQDHDYEKAIKELKEKTYLNMLKIKENIERAIDRIQNWNGSKVVITPDVPEDMSGKIIDVQDSAYIEVGEKPNSPGFSYFIIDNKLIIDDVIEGGDEDFFTSLQQQSDYFNLINELRNPGKTSIGKNLTLFTARPIEDREYILKTNKLPVNVFLCNNYNHTEGLAIDLTSGKPRDIWKVKVNSKYLTQTLDGNIKYYQLTTSDAPMSVELYSTFDR